MFTATLLIVSEFTRILFHFSQAGPGTIAEAMIKGLPMLLFDFIAGQVDFSCLPQFALLSYIVDSCCYVSSRNPQTL